MKVVVNRCYGGFSISLETGRWMAERGHKHAAAEVAEYDAKIASPDSQDDMEKKYGVRFFGYGYMEGFEGPYKRDDPLLVGAVEALGEKASGRVAKLAVVEIPDGVDWEIDEYDGMERVAEKHRTW